VTDVFIWNPHRTYGSYFGSVKIGQLKPTAPLHPTLKNVFFFMNNYMKHYIIYKRIITGSWISTYRLHIQDIFSHVNPS
jgi:hypothetical protein